MKQGQIYETVKGHVYSFVGVEAGETRFGGPLDVPEQNYAVLVGRKLYLCKVAKTFSKLTRVR